MNTRESSYMAKSSFVDIPFNHLKLNSAVNLYYRDQQILSKEPRLGLQKLTNSLDKAIHKSCPARQISSSRFNGSFTFLLGLS